MISMAILSLPLHVAQLPVNGERMYSKYYQTPGESYIARTTVSYVATLVFDFFFFFFFALLFFGFVQSLHAL